MDFQISCETYVRLSKIAQSATEPQLRCIYLECKNGEALAVATNRRIAAVEYLGKTATPNGSCKLVIDTALIEQCKTETAFNSILYVTVNEMLKFASAKTTLGYNYPGNAALFIDGGTEWDSWRSWTPDKPASKSKGAMFWNADNIALLGASSPTGRLAFPEFIDAAIPIVLRDTSDDRWFGLFMPGREGDDGKLSPVEPAKLPEWYK